MAGRERGESPEVIDHGPVAREVARPESEEGRLERAIGEQLRRMRR